MYQTIRVVLMVTICILSKRIWLEPKVRLTIWSFRLNERSVNHKRSFRDKMVDFRDIVWPHKAEHLTIRFLQIENRKTSSEFSLTTKIPFSYFKFATSSEIQMKQKSRQNWGKTMNAKQVKNSAFKHFMKCQRSYHILRRYRCWWRMLETECVGDKFKMFVTDSGCWWLIKYIEKITNMTKKITNIMILSPNRSNRSVS